MKKQEDQIEFGRTRIQYEILRTPDRALLTVRVNPDQSVEVRAPKGTRRTKIKERVATKAEWILKQQRRYAKQLKPARREYVSGETYLYLGRQYTLKLVAVRSRPSKDAKCLQGRLFVEVDQRWGDKNRREHVRRALTKWYRRRATTVLQGEADAYSKRIGLGSNRVRLKQMRQRWASCTPDGTLYFDWRIIMASRRLVQYVAAHEVCHLVHPTHGKEFWSLLERVMPDYLKRQSALERIGSRLTL